MSPRRSAIAKIPVREDRERNAHCRQELRVRLEVRAGDRADGDAEVVERQVHRRGKRRNKETLSVALDQNDSAGEEHLGPRHIEIARQVVSLIVRQAGIGAGVSDRPILTFILDQQQGADRGDAGDMRRMRCQEYRERFRLVVVLDALEQVSVD
jgi:hypothetical protein